MTRRLAQGRMSEIKRSKTYVRFPVEVAIADLFNFEAYNECVPGRMCVNFQTARNASCNPSSCFSFLVGLQYRFWVVGPVRARADLGHHARTLEFLRC